MKVIVSNRTGRDLWFSIVLTHELEKGAPAPRLSLFTTSKELGEKHMRNGQLICSERMVVGGLFHRDEIPDVSELPRCLFEVALGEFRVRRRIIGDNKQRFLVVIIGDHSANEEKPADKKPAPHPNGMPNAITVRNTLDETVSVTFFKGVMDSEYPGEEGVNILMLLVSKDELPPEAFAGNHFLRHQRLKPGKSFILKRMPMFDSLGIAIEDRFCDTVEQQTETLLGLTLSIDIVPNP